MAKIITNESFSTIFNFVDSPVIVKVKNETNVQGSSLHQTVVEVRDVTSLTTGTSPLYSFSREIMPGGELILDISSALRSLLASHTWDPTVVEVGHIITYPKCQFAVRAVDRYMRDGELVEEKDKEDWLPENAQAAYLSNAYLGGLSDMERLVYNKKPDSFYTTFNFSHKPSSGARWGENDLLISSKFDTASQSVTSDVSVVTTDQVNIHDEHYHFLFVNSLGVFETVSAVMKESLSYTVQGETLTRQGETSYKPSANTVRIAQAPTAAYEMSSGQTTREWAAWWTTEFLLAKHHWIRLTFTGNADTMGSGQLTKTIWVPCIITPAEEETVIFDKAQQRLPHVDFNVKLAISGALF